MKQNYQKNWGDRPSCMNSGFLLFLLHTGGFYSNFHGKEGISFYHRRMRTLWNWHKLLSSSQVSLFHTTDYTSIPIPTQGRSLVVSNTPDYEQTRHSGRTWRPSSCRSFTDYYNHLTSNTEHFLLCSANSNPTFRSQFQPKNGWNTYKVLDTKTRSPLEPSYNYRNRNLSNTDRCLVSNYELNLPTQTLVPKNTLHTEEFLVMYHNYLSNLL